MNQKKLVQLVFAAQAAMGVGLAALALLLFRDQELLNKSRDVEFQSYLIADELRQSSDDLTRMARSYVATGNTEFESQYWAVLDIRNGKIPRPTDYNRIYWDLVLAPGQKPRPDGETISLKDLMIMEGFSEAEFQKLAEAQKNSDELVKTETIAMNAVKGLFDDGTGHFTVKKEPDREMALRLMNDAAYREKKFNIMRPIDEFYVMFRERTAKAVAVRQQRSQNLLIGLIVLIIATVGMFGLSFLALLRQITRHEADQQALRQSEERYRTLFDRANDGIFLLSAEGRLVSINESFARMHGYNANEMLNMKLQDLDTPESFQAAPARMRRLLAGEALTFEVEHYHRDGHAFPLEVSASPISLGRESLILGFHRDITDRKRAEEEKARLEAQLQQAQKMESVGRLAGGVAHDFNNMLGVILGHTEMILDRVDPEQPIHAALEEIQKAARRSADLTRQLLAFARKQTIAPKVLDLNETVAGTLKMLHRLIGENIQLGWQPGADLWPVRADPSQIDQILANLCVNGRDAITGVGKLTIQTGNNTFDAAYCTGHPGFAPGKYVHLSVRDDGCGMDKETLAHIFEPFFTTKGVGKGTGLGLASVYGAVEQNSGFVHADSEPGQGTTIAIYLPRLVSEAGHARTENTAEPATRGHETVLLVEDDPALLKMTGMMLEAQGYDVLAASTPNDAIRLAGEHAGEIHLLMTDVVMPGMNGRDLAKNLLSLYPQLKRLFMSGYAAEVIALTGELDEGVCFIQKPFSKAELAAKVRVALEKE